MSQKADKVKQQPLKEVGTGWQKRLPALLILGIVLVQIKKVFVDFDVDCQWWKIRKTPLDSLQIHAIMTLSKAGSRRTISMPNKYRQKGIDEEKYIRFRMDREKVAGENFREGRMEVTFELWAEQDMLSRFQRRSPPLSGGAISEDHRNSVTLLAGNGPRDGSRYFPVLS